MAKLVKVSRERYSYLYLFLLLVFIVSVLNTAAGLESEKYEIEEEDDVIVRVVKRESDPPKKPYSEKKVKVKGDPGKGEEEAHEGNDKTKYKDKAESSTLSPDLVSISSEMPPLPSALPGNYTYEGDVNVTEENATASNKTHYFVYYNAQFLEDSAANLLWVDLENNDKVFTHSMLSNSYRRAATLQLSFDFPFYGHIVRNLTIATGGFLYTGNYMHTWLAATQYIAPLMANFDTSIHNHSLIKYLDNGSTFTVQWDKVFLQDKSQGTQGYSGPFTFQVTLNKNGNIAFVYREVATDISNIEDDSHPVKVGLSDAYIIDKMVVFIRRKTIYEYHRADVSHLKISNNTAILFTALPTCQSFTDCTTCMGANTSFECVWCESVSRCSSGLDRHRQEWMTNKCDHTRPEHVHCDKLPPPSTTPVPIKVTTKKPFPSTKIPLPSPTPSSTQPPVIAPVITDLPISLPPKLVTLAPSSDFNHAAEARVSDEVTTTISGNNHLGAGAVVAIFAIVCLVAGFGLWTVYAYKYPQTPSGQLLIRYRPSQWRMRHGEARYTAASIHI